MDNNQKPAKDTPETIKRIIKQVYILERDRLSAPKPKGIMEDVIDVIKREIQ